MFTNRLSSRFVSGLFVFIFTLAQVNPAYAAPGDLDPSFGSNGFVTTSLVIQNYNDAGKSISIQASAEQPDSKIVMVGWSYLIGFGNVFTTLRYNNDGSLDTSFDGDGVVTTSVGGSSDQASSVAIQPDGKIVVAGTVYGSSTSNQYRFGVVRYNADGSLDTSFSMDGKVVTNVVAGGYQEATSVAIQPDGKIVVVGFTYAYPDPFITVRYNSDGSLDTSFDTDGIATTFVGTYANRAAAVAIQSDGKIVVAGTATWSSPSYYYQFLVLRYNDDGSLDTSFDADGIATTSVGTYSQGYAVAIQPDGKIVAVGYGRDNDFAVVRYNSDGSLDNSFSADGMMTTNVSGRDFARSVAIQDDGQIVVAGVTDPSYYGKYQFGVIRLNGSDGSLDTSFDSDGILATSVFGDNDEANSVMVQSDGRIVVGGLANNPVLGETDFALVRYNSDGTLDSAFDGDGKVTTNVSRIQYSTEGYDVAVQNDGKIVMVGGLQQSSFWQFMVTRFNTDGSFDTSFDTDGIVTTLTIPNSGYSHARAVEIQEDGKIVVAGFAQNQMIVVRYNSDGSLDTSFGTNGIVATTAGGNYAQAYALAIQSDGQIVVGGLIYGPPNYLYQFGVVRLNGGDGSLDTSFDTDGIVTTSVGGTSDTVYSVAIQNDGKIVAAGNAYGPVTNNQTHFGVVRYNSDGSLDTSFDTDGVVTTNPNGYYNQVKSLAIQGDGQILVAGHGYSPTYNSRFTVVRYNASDGSLDTSFDTDGIAAPSLGGNSDQASSMAIQEDGQIVVAGYAYGPATNYQNRIGVVRLNKNNGSLDTSFNDDGIAFTTVSGYSDTVNALAIQPDGKIVVGGQSYFSGTYAAVFMVLRLEGGGSIPPLLDQTITVTTSAPASAYAGDVFTVEATASSGLPVSYSSSGSCTNTGADFTITSDTGDCIVMYDQGGDANYNPAPQVIEIVTAQPALLDQTITVTINAPSSAIAGDVFTVEAVASSGLPVSYTASGECSNIDGTFTMESGSSDCTVMYDQAGDGIYNPAPQVVETVTGINSAPVITEGDSVNVTMSQDGSPNPFSLTLHATDVDALLLTWDISEPAQHGIAGIGKGEKGKCAKKGDRSCSLSSDTKILYNPEVGYHGTDSFDVQVSDGELTDTITVNVTIEATVLDQSITIITNAPANARAGDIFTVEATASSGLPVAYSSAGDCTNVDDTFTVVSGTGDCTVMYDQPGDANYNPAPQVIEVVADGNDAPFITEGNSINVTMSEDGSPLAFNLTLHATDADGDSLNWSISSPANRGTASVSGTGTSKSVSYAPNPDYNGSDTFEVRVDDGNLADTITVNVTINSVNDAPVITEGDAVNVVISEDGAPTAFSLTLPATDIDSNLSALDWHISAVYPPSHGSASVGGPGSSVAVTYAPSANYFGSDSFGVEVNDGFNRDTIIVNVTIDPVNDSPANVSLSASSINEGLPSGTTVGSLTTSDVDSTDTHTYTLVNDQTTCLGMDNGSFSISGSDLQTASVFNASIKKTYTICVLSTDSGSPNLSYRKQFTITVNDVTAPQASSIVRASANPTSSTNVDFTVTFSETVTGVDASDFTLATTGVSGAAVSGVSGSGDVYTVAVNTGTGNGTIRLDVVDDDSILDVASNSLGNGFTSGEVYDVNKGSSTAPSKPTLVSPAGGSLTTDYTPLFDWNNSTVPAGVIFSHYQLQVATDSGFTAIVVDENVSGITNSEFAPSSDLTSNVRYYWRVRAVNAQGTASAWSNVRNFDTAFLPPSLIAPNDAEQLSSPRPHFDWDDVSGVSGYRIEISSDPLNFSNPVVAKNVTPSSYGPTADLPLAQTLYWRVQSRGANGPSAWSEVRSLVTANPPSVPTLAAPANGAKVSVSSLVFDWNDSTLPAGVDFDHYQIQVATDNGFVNVVHDNNVSGVTNSQDDTVVLAEGATYYWRVRAFNTLGHGSAWSSVRNVKIKFAGPILLAPGNGITVDSLIPTFTWEAVDGATSYTLQVSKNSSFSGAKAINVTTTDPTYTHGVALQSGVTYYWRVRVKTPTTYAPGDWSEVFIFTAP